MNNWYDKLKPWAKKWINSLQEWATGNEYVYDIECYPNLFTCTVIHVKTLQVYYYECSEWFNNMQDFNSFLYYLHINECCMIGFNNFGYDWPVTSHAFYNIPVGVTPQVIYQKSDSIINGDYERRFDHVIWPSDQFVRQIDLFKINHYDNTAKATSLKMLENNFGMDDIQDLPVEPGKNVTRAERDQIPPYNLHDCVATMLHLSRCTGQIDLRAKLSAKFNHDFTNASDAKIGGDIFKLKLQEAGLPVNQKTPRDVIHFKDCIFNYVAFERDEFIQLHTWLYNHSITQTKECLNDILVPWSLAKYMNPEEVIVSGLSEAVLTSMKLRKNQKVKLSLVPPGSDMTGCEFKATHLHVIVDGFQFDLGTGGIHGSIASAIVRASDTHDLVDVDVASYYPNLGIQNDLYPAHLGTAFCKIYLDIYNTRKSYNKKTHPMENLAFKLALNAAYGNSNNKHSFLFDSQYTMTITLNGQLLLCMLAEQLLKVPGLTLVQINTDGVTYLTPKEYKEHTLNLCRWWESVTKLELEDVDYKAMYIRDVNNYIAEYIGGGNKNKGAYEHSLVDSNQWHKNFSCLIIAKAAEAALLHDIPVRRYIEDHLYDPDSIKLFCMREKVDRNTQLMIDDQPVQRVTRYYAAINGGDMYKIMKPTQKQIQDWQAKPHFIHVDNGKYIAAWKAPSGKYRLAEEHERQPLPADRRISSESDCKVAECNKLDKFDWNNLNVEYYIAKAAKLVDPLLQ